MTIFTNALQIPSLFEGLYVSIQHIAFLMVLPVLGIAILHENTMQMEARGNYGGLFVRVLLILGLLIIYKRFFTMITYGTDLLGDTIMPDDEFNNILQSVFTEVRQDKDFGVFNFFKGSILNAVTYMTYLLTLVAYTVLIWLRFMLLSLLYIAGPILIAFGIYHKTAGALGSWMRSLFQISAWTVTLSLLVRIASFMNLTAIYNIENVNTISVITANVLFVLLFVFTPAITSSLISDGSIGNVGSTMIGIATTTSFAFFRKMNLRKAAQNLRKRSFLQNASQSDE